jgi:serine/threonine protein kinase
VKQSRLPETSWSQGHPQQGNGQANAAESFERSFGQFTREPRILGNRKLREHPNILNVIGICIDEIHIAPAPAVVLEYSSQGKLKSFLNRLGDDLTVEKWMDLVLHAARGLEALHQLKVCHADVKLENALVFRSLEREDCRD